LKGVKKGGPMWSNKKIILKLKINKKVRWNIFSSQIISFFRCKNKIIRRKLGFCNQSICNYLQLSIICDYHWVFFQLLFTCSCPCNYLVINIFSFSHLNNI
jgi:hypothetical protein